MSLTRDTNPQVGSDPSQLRRTEFRGTDGEHVPQAVRDAQHPPQVDHSTSSSFWLELKGVEAWFDGLELSERHRLMSSLIARSQDAQLYQYASLIDSNLRQSPSAVGLSRFGTHTSNSQPSLVSPTGSIPSQMAKPTPTSPNSTTGNSTTTTGPNINIYRQLSSNSNSVPLSTSPNNLDRRYMYSMRKPFSPWSEQPQGRSDVWETHSHGSPMLPNSSLDLNISSLSLDSSISLNSQWNTRLRDPEYAPASVSPTISPIHSAGSAFDGQGPRQNFMTELRVPMSERSLRSAPNSLNSVDLSHLYTPSHASGNAGGQSSQNLSNQSPARNQEFLQQQPTTRSTYGTANQQQPPRPAPLNLELLDDMGAWLRSMRLHKYTANLGSMNWQDIILLDNEQLKSMGVNALGARRKLLKMFEEIKAAQEAGLLGSNENRKSK